MQMIRLYTGDDGITHLEDMEPKDMRFLASEMVIRSSATNLPFSLAQRALRQVLIVRTGNVKVEVEDGDVRQLAPGDMVLEEDLTGKGHRGIPVDDQPVVLSAVVLE